MDLLEHKQTIQAVDNTQSSDSFLRWCIRSFVMSALALLILAIQLASVVRHGSASKFVEVSKFYSDCFNLNVHVQCQ